MEPAHNPILDPNMDVPHAHTYTHPHTHTHTHTHTQGKDSRTLINFSVTENMKIWVDADVFWHVAVLQEVRSEFVHECEVFRKNCEA